MINVVAMICAATISTSVCDIDNARDVAVVNQTFSEIGCSAESEGDVAKNSIYQDLAAGEYIKIRCIRTEEYAKIMKEIWKKKFHKPELMK